MKKAFLLFLFVPFATAAAANDTRVPFYGGGWDVALGHQFETVVDAKNDKPGMDLGAFWKARDPEKILSEALVFLKQSKRPGGYWTDDPNSYEISITAIRMENLPSTPGFNSRPWYVIVELSAWGKQQHTGLPLWFQLVLIPGKGFKTPTLVEKRTEPNQSSEPTAPSGRGSP